MTYFVVRSSFIWIFSFFMTNVEHSSDTFYNCCFQCSLTFNLAIIGDRTRCDDASKRPMTDLRSLAVWILSLTYALEPRERHARNTHTPSRSIYNAGNPMRYSNCRFSTGHRGGTLQGTAWCRGTIILRFHRRHHHRHLAALILPVSGLNGRICHNPFQHLRQCRQWVAIMTCNLPSRS